MTIVSLVSHLSTTAASQCRTSIGRHTWKSGNIHTAVSRPDPFRSHTTSLWTTAISSSTQWLDSV